MGEESPNSNDFEALQYDALIPEKEIMIYVYDRRKGLFITPNRKMAHSILVSQHNLQSPVSMGRLYRRGLRIYHDNTFGYNQGLDWDEEVPATLIFEQLTRNNPNLLIEELADLRDGIRE